MATWLTYPVKNGETTFEEFVWSCAEMFFCDGGIPPTLVVETNDHRVRRIEEMKKEMCELMFLTEAEYEAQQEAERLAEDKHRKGVLEQTAIEEKRYNDMIAKVKAWTVTDPESQKLKDLMLKQLEESLIQDCAWVHEIYPAGVEEKKAVSLEAFRVEEARILADAIELYTESDKKAREQAEIVTRWLKKLNEEIPRPGA